MIGREGGGILSIRRTAPGALHAPGGKPAQRGPKGKKESVPGGSREKRRICWT